LIKVPNLDLNRKKGNVVSLIDWFAARRKDQFVGKVSQDTDEGDGLWVICSECSQVAYRKDLIQTTRIGISKAKNIKWRWYLKSSRSVSKRLKGDRTPKFK